MLQKNYNYVIDGKTFPQILSPEEIINKCNTMERRIEKHLCSDLYYKELDYLYMLRTQ